METTTSVDHNNYKDLLIITSPKDIKTLTTTIVIILVAYYAIHCGLWRSKTDMIMEYDSHVMM